MEENTYTEQEIANAWVQAIRETQQLNWTDFLRRLEENRIKKKKNNGRRETIKTTDEIPKFLVWTDINRFKTRGNDNEQSYRDNEKL